MNADTFKDTNQYDIGSFSRLLSISTMTLTTFYNGDIHAAPVYFAADAKPRLYFFSDEKSLHIQHISKNPQVAAAIYPECKGWQDIRGLQIHGKACKVESSDEWNSAWMSYKKKFPFVKSLKAIVSRNLMYVLIPSWVRLIDNSRGFGYKTEWTLNS